MKARDFNRTLSEDIKPHRHSRNTGGGSGSISVRFPRHNREPSEVILHVKDGKPLTSEGKALISQLTTQGVSHEN